MTDAPIKTKGTADFFNEALLTLARDHAEELKGNHQIADEMGGLMTISAKCKVAKGPLAGHTLKVSIAVDPEDED